MKRRKPVSKFEELIESLGQVLNVSLQAEQGYMCKLNAGGTIKLQIEYNEKKDNIVIASFLTELPPGKFREDVLMAGLKANGTEDSFGIFAFSSSNDNLILQLYLPISITPQNLADKIKQFIEKGTEWKEAIEQGNISLVSKPATNHLISPFKLTR